MTILCNIGGTNVTAARFDGQALVDDKVWRTADFGDAGELIAALSQAYGIDRACLALAGPVRQGRARLTNAPLYFDAAALARAHGLPRLDVLNDVEAVAWSVAPGPGDTLVLNIGTGFGGALVRPGPAVLPVEPGRLSSLAMAPLAWSAPVQAPFFELEHLLSGAGFSRHHASLAGADEIGAEAVFERAAAGDPVAQKAIDDLWTLLGVVAGELTLLFKDVERIVFSGGVVLKNRESLAASGFTEAMTRRRALAREDAPIAVATLADAQGELRGLANFSMGAPVLTGALQRL